MNRFALENLSWELSVLSRAVAYKNLSGAAQNVGISQPQLSRIIGKIEGELGCVLLDRSIRRKSGWTALAFSLSETYLKTFRNLNSTVEKLVEGDEPRLLHIGALEGLVPLAVRFAREMTDRTGISTVDLDVYDLHQLEERFFRGDLDLIFTAREPGRKKYRYHKVLGYQSLQQIESNERYRVMSTFEYGVYESKLKKSRAVKDSVQKTIISNSLAVRRAWIENFGGIGTLPSAVRAEKRTPASLQKVIENDGVFIFGQDSIHPAFWKKISDLQPAAL